MKIIDWIKGKQPTGTKRAMLGGVIVLLLLLAIVYAGTGDNAEINSGPSSGTIDANTDTENTDVNSNIDTKAKSVVAARNPKSLYGKWETVGASQPGDLNLKEDGTWIMTREDEETMSEAEGTWSVSHNTNSAGEKKFLIRLNVLFYEITYSDGTSMSNGGAEKTYNIAVLDKDFLSGVGANWRKAT